MNNANDTLNKLMNAAKAIKMAATAAEAFAQSGSILVADAAEVAGVELNTAKAVLLDACRARQINLSRADMGWVAELDQDAVAASEIRGAAGSTFHFISIR